MPSPKAVPSSEATQCSHESRALFEQWMVTELGRSDVARYPLNSDEHYQQIVAIAWAAWQAAQRNIRIVGASPAEQSDQPATENAALRKDAERLDWMEADMRANEPFWTCGFEGRFQHPYFTPDGQTFETLRAAIDAAMEAK